MHLMISTSQENNLSEKAVVEIWAGTFGGKINIYHANNGRFSEQQFRSAIENSNQELTFCWFGSHHKNTIVEIKIQTLTLGDRTLILHAKRYWTDAITTMLWPYELKDFSDQLNELKVDDDVITPPMEKFAGTTLYITPKITTHGDVQFISLVQFYKAT